MEPYQKYAKLVSTLLNTEVYLLYRHYHALHFK